MNYDIAPESHVPVLIATIETALFMSDGKDVPGIACFPMESGIEGFLAI